MGKKKYKKLKKEIYNLYNETNDIHDAILTWDKKVNRIDDKLNHIDERTMALDTVKVQKTLDMMKEQLQKAKELDSKIKILMDRTTIDYSKMSSQEISYQECISLIYCMRDRGATKEEINSVKKLMNKYIFRCKLLLIDDEVPTPEEIIDGKKEI